MRVCLFADGAALRHPGGLQVQLRETAAALARLRAQCGVEVCTLAGGARLPECDVLHIIGVDAGAEAMAAQAAALGVPVLLSARLAGGWTSSDGTRARVADRILGNRSDWNGSSAYARVRSGLQGAARVVALDERERRAICKAFLVDPAKICVIPNAACARFFDADPGPFRERSRIAGQFALMVGDVTPYHRQLDVAQLLRELALPLVVVGEARERDAAYLRQLRRVPTVSCLGAFKHGDAALAGAYAAASVHILCGEGAALPMTALEALAAGAPVVTAGRPPAALPGSGFALRQLAAAQGEAVQREVAALLEAPPARDKVSALVRSFTWESVAMQLLDCYRALA